MKHPPQNIVDEAASNLTPAQLLIWVGQQRSPHAPLYNMALNFTIAGPIDRDLFGQALQSVVDRCDAMRTVFRVHAGVPQRIVLPDLTTVVDYFDASAESDPKAAMQQWTQDRCCRIFDLEQALFDSALVELSHSEFVWYFNQHHLVADAWSFGLIHRLVSDAYCTLRDGSAVPPAVPPQFEDFADGQARHTRPRAAVAHWQQRLNDSAGPPRLYGEISARASTRTERQTLDLSRDRCDGLRRLAGEPRFQMLTPHMSQYCLIATVLYAFLYRVTAQRRLAVGCPAHNRASMAHKQTVGLFIELYPMQLDVDPDDTFETLFEKVRGEAGMMLRHAQPGCCHPELLRRFNVVLNYITASFGDFAGQPVESEWLHPGHGDPGHEFRLQVHDFDNSGLLKLHFDFNTDTLNEAYRARATSHFERILDAMLADPQRAITDVDIVSAEEREELLANDLTGVAQPAQQTLTELFESQAERMPHLTAVVCGARELTYGQLEEQVAVLADRLCRDGLQPGVSAVVCLRRSPELIVSLLAVAKAGGVWIPVDPSYPGKRIGFVAADAGAKFFLTDSHSVDLAPPDCRVVCVDGASVGKAITSGTHVVREPDDPAYMIYTSGSTGRPKGVIIPNRAIVNYLTWAAEYYAGEEPLALPFFSPVAFDLTLTSVLLPLVSGGRVLVYPEAPGRSDLALLDVVDENRVNAIKLTPSHLTLLQERDLSGSRIRRVIIGGEDLKRDVAERTRTSIGNGVTVYNEYGPTEATIGCVAHSYDPGAEPSVSVPIGRPIDNTAAYVLNNRLHLCPTGVPGDLFIAGDGVATAYRGLPDLTVQRFIENPQRPGTRMYQTGDLARVRPSGVIEYLGRTDQQVKVRGSRIELGEIEAALREHAAIGTCVIDVCRERTQSESVITYCHRCGLPSNFPDTSFDSVGICDQCRAFEGWQERAAGYFKSMEDLPSVFSSAGGEHDCLLLLSGGKDSTYALCRLVELGLNVLAFTLDNGYISQSAKDNIDRVVATLGVDHVYGSTPAMNAIFVDSLKRHANVCHGCFKTIYTLSVNEARRRGIRFIVTGLSRGQFFETRLTSELFSGDQVDPEHADRTILEARKAYHRVDDAVHQLLDVDVFRDDRIFEEIEFIDFYRYCDVGLDEMLTYLAERVPWIRPADTGRSTNCLINDVGIHVHQARRGFHNYAFPYSWDVRMGHKTREAALAELNDDIDEKNVERILSEIGFDEPVRPERSVDQLVAWYTAVDEVTVADLRAHLGETLPSFMLPAHFVRVDEIPLTPGGKIDRAALPSPRLEKTSEASFVSARTRNERVLADIWADALGLPTVSICDHFIDLGGDSITAIRIVGRANRAGLRITVDQLFESGSIESLAREARTSATLSAEQGLVSGDVRLSPVQLWFFEQPLTDANHWNNVLLLDLSHELRPDHLESAFRVVLRHHDALRLSFRQDSNRRWVARNEAALPAEAIVQSHDLTGPDARARTRRVADIESQLNAGLDIHRGILLKAALLNGDDRPQLLIVAHHLAVDAFSWPILLEDLSLACRQISSGGTTGFAPKTTSFRKWAETLPRRAASNEAHREIGTWLDGPPVGAGLPNDDPPAAEGAENGSETVRLQLTAEETDRLLTQTVPGIQARVHEILIAGLCRCLSRRTGCNDVVIDVETSGRETADEDCDISRTVGWFTALFPFAASVDNSQSLEQTALAIQPRLRDMSRRSLYFGIMRRFGDLQTQTALADWQPDTLFNYLGVISELAPANSLFRLSRPLSLSRGTNRAAHKLEVNAMIADDRLQVDWTFRADILHRETIERLADQLATDLRGMLTKTEAAPAKPATSYPLANLNEQKLDKLASLLRKTDGPRGEE